MRETGFFTVVSVVLLGLIVIEADAQFIGWEAENYSTSNGNPLTGDPTGYFVVLNPPLTETADPDQHGGQFDITEASGNTFLGIPNSPEPLEGGIWVKYEFEIPEAGDWYFWGRVIAPSLFDNSFYWAFDIDDADALSTNNATINVWDLNEAIGDSINFPLGRDITLEQREQWTWFRISSRDGPYPYGGENYGDPTPLDFTPGTHTLHLIDREKGVFVDRFFATTEKSFDANDTEPAPPDPSEPAGHTFEWKSANSGDWNVPGNWTAGGPPGNQGAVRSSHHVAVFGDTIGSESRTVFTDSSVTVNSISFINAMGGSYRISGEPSVNVNASTAGTSASVGVAAGSHEFQAPFGIHSNTTANIANGATLTFNNALNLNGQTLSKTGDGTMTVNNVLSAGGGGSIIGAGGIIGGVGTVGGDLDNSGATVAPGNSSGVLAVDGSYTQGSGGTLAMEIEGLAGPGEGGHDQLAVVGTASLDGTLGVTPVGGYADPTVRGNSDSFTLLTSTGLSGTFATVNYDGATLDSGGHAGNGLFRKVDYTANDVVFTNLLAKAGDVEGDSDVDITDFNALASNYDPSGANAPHDWTEGDFDDNDTIDLTDFNGLATNFSPGGYGGGPDQVPEPASWVLVVMAILAGTSLIGRVWRR